MTAFPGFPAHAGMDLRQMAVHHPQGGFPRPRGDGPGINPPDRITGEVSPPTRGWTRQHLRVRERRCGFPAHAGMDLPDSGHLRAPIRFPRPRGDGPSQRLSAAAIKQVSPPTRGWTAVAGDGRRAGRGFPAHAGMDLWDTREKQWEWRFPRPRGDGPETGAWSVQYTEVSPPTRGWTLGWCFRHRWHRGFPAHAGMDPDDRRRAAPHRRFPRPRGDGPPTATGPTASCTVSPPTRGWTRVARIPCVRLAGFPAHAGMDPVLTVVYDDTNGFPRPRGDGPCAGCGEMLICGVSPPTRGWTDYHLIPARIVAGFPAHAGMDRCPASLRAGW